MPRRNEEAFKHERAAFEAEMAAARAALDAGEISRAVDLVVSPAHEYWYGKDPLRFKLFRDLYELIGDRVDESIYRRTPWQAKLLTKLYSVWPKRHLESAVLKHDFPESDVNLRLQLLDTLEIDADTHASVTRQIQEQKVSGAEAVHVARYYTGIIAKSWGVLSRGRFWLKFWDLESGEVIRADEHGLPMLASAIGRDGSHVLFSEPFHNTNTGELCWTTEFRQTFRQISTGRAGDYHKSHYTNVQYYKLHGEVLSEERNPFALIIAHDEIEGYLPAQTTTFTAVDGFGEPKVTEAYCREAGSARLWRSKMTMFGWKTSWRGVMA